MNDYYIRAAVQTADSGDAVSENGADPLEDLMLRLSGADAGPRQSADERLVTLAELRQILHALLSNLKVYVLETDITSSQSAVRTIIEQSQF